MSTLYRKGQKFKNWELIEYLGGGGNGEVWKCTNENEECCAVKLLKKINPKSYTRFIDETTVLEKNADIEGIIPIKEKFLPDLTEKEIPFYIMPVAETSESKLSNKTIEQKVEAVVQIAETLTLLHERKIYHRDIKPGNILYFKNRFSLADFGLVDYPNKKDVSDKNEHIGPKWTMAPEMRRESSSADLSKADVYSLAKTLWIFLSGKDKGFDGQYSTQSIIDLKNFYPTHYTSPIDNLLIQCTDNDPNKRPSCKEFIIHLKHWLEISADFHRQNQQEWFEIQTKLFPTSIPSRVIWEDINDIVKVLKLVSSIDNLNHMFMPNGGGLDLEDVRLSHERGCIELDFQLIEIVKPKRLLFESFGYDHIWNYFRLELDELSPVPIEDVDENQNPIHNDSEYLSELSPGNYYSYKILDNRSHYEELYHITDFSRHVTRQFRGSYVIFCKRSTYNLIPDTYDGRHNKMTTEEFRTYIANTVSKLKKEDDRRKSIEDALLKNENRAKFNDRIEKIPVFRCGWCGGFVDEKGHEIGHDERKYFIKIFEKYGSSVVQDINGHCCVSKWKSTGM